MVFYKLFICNNFNNHYHNERWALLTITMSTIGNFTLTNYVIYVSKLIIKCSLLCKILIIYVFVTPNQHYDNFMSIPHLRFTFIQKKYANFNTRRWFLICMSSYPFKYAFRFHFHSLSSWLSWKINLPVLWHLNKFVRKQLSPVAVLKTT